MIGVELQSSRIGIINAYTDEKEHSVSYKREWNYKDGKIILQSTECHISASREEEISYSGVEDYRNGKITGDDKNYGKPYPHRALLLPVPENEDKEETINVKFPLSKYYTLKFCLIG